MTQTDFSTEISNTIKYLLANLYYEHAKEYAKFKGKIEETIAEQDATVLVNICIMSVL